MNLTAGLVTQERQNFHIVGAEIHARQATLALIEAAREELDVLEQRLQQRADDEVNTAALSRLPGRAALWRELWALRCACGLQRPMPGLEVLSEPDPA